MDLKKISDEIIDKMKKEVVKSIQESMRHDKNVSREEDRKAQVDADAILDIAQIKEAIKKFPEGSPEKAFEKYLDGALTAGTATVLKRSHNIEDFVDGLFKNIELTSINKYVLYDTINNRMWRNSGDVTTGSKAFEEIQKAVLEKRDSLPDNASEEAKSIFPRYKALCQDLGVHPTIEQLTEIYIKLSTEIDKAGGMNNQTLRDQAINARIEFDKPFGLAWNGIEDTDKALSGDQKGLYEFKMKAKSLGMFRQTGPETSEQSEEDTKKGLIPQNTIATFHALNDDELEQYRLALNTDEAASANFNPRQISRMIQDPKGGTANYVTMIADLSTVTEINRTKLRGAIEALIKDDPQYKDMDIDAIMRDALSSEVKKMFESKDKATRKEAKRLYGKNFAEFEKNYIPITSPIGQHAMRNLMIADSKKHFKAYMNNPDNADLKRDKELDELMLKKALLRDMGGIDSEKLKDGEDKTVIANQIFISIQELAEREVPNMIFNTMQANVDLIKNGAADEFYQAVFNNITSLGNDKGVFALVAQLQKQFKDRGIKFDNDIIDGERQGTIGNHIAKIFMNHAQQHANAYMKNVETKSQVKGPKGQEYRQAANDLFDTGVVRANTGAEIEPASGKARGKYHPSVSKPPYRALATNMKMMSQLAAMMCKSFQKTIGAGGFYTQTTPEQFNAFIGFGQNLDRRADDIHGFFFGEGIEPKEEDGRSRTEYSHGVDNKGNSNFKQMVMFGQHMDENFKKMCTALGIDASAEALQEFLRTDDPRKVEKAIKAIPELQKKFGPWLEQYGREAQEAAKDKRAREDGDLLEAIIEGRGKEDEDVKKYKKLVAMGKEEEAKAIFADEIKQLRIEEGLDKEEAVATDSNEQQQSPKDVKISKALGQRALLAETFNRVEIHRLKSLKDRKIVIDATEISQIDDDMAYLVEMQKAYQGIPGLAKNFSPEVVAGMDMDQFAALSFIYNKQTELTKKMHDKGLSPTEKAELAKYNNALGEVTSGGDLSQATEDLVDEIIKGQTPKYGGNPPVKSRTGHHSDDQKMERLAEVLSSNKDDVWLASLMTDILYAGAKDEKGNEIAGSKTATVVTKEEAEAFRTKLDKNEWKKHTGSAAEFMNYVERQLGAFDRAIAERKNTMGREVTTDKKEAYEKKVFSDEDTLIADMVAGGRYENEASAKEALDKMRE